MAGAEPLARVAVEILVEEHEVAPMRIGGKTLIGAMTTARRPCSSGRNSRTSRAANSRATALQVH